MEVKIIFVIQTNVRVITSQILPSFCQILACKTNLAKQPVRNLNVHEHISYSLLNEAGVPTPKFGVAKTADEAAKLATNLKTKDIVLKAQVLAGGRGKGHFKGTNISGVKMCET